MVFISLEAATDRQYAELRRRFLKDAKKHYSKEAWESGYFRGLAAIGATLGVGGAVLTYLSESPFCMIPGLVGVVNMCQALYNKHTVTKIVVETLAERTSKLDHAELEKRVEAKDYELPEPSEEEMKDAQMNVYALNVMQSVAEKDFGIMKYPWSLAGAGVAGFGIYKSFDDPVAGGFTLAFGSMLYLAAHFMKRRKIAKIAKDAAKFLKEKGYTYFDNYVRRKDPYDFYHVQMMRKSAGAD